MRIGLGNDPRGYYLKKSISYYLQEQMHPVIDLGTRTGFEAVDYSLSVASVCTRVQAGDLDCGILVGGTGIGMCILANKYPGIQAALVQDVYSAKRARQKYDVNILCLGEQVCGEGTARMIIETWLDSTFQKEQYSEDALVEGSSSVTTPTFFS